MPTIPKVEFNAWTSGEITGTLKDQADNPIGSGDLDALLLSIYKQGDGTRTLRTSVDLLADPRFTINVLGEFTWNVRPCDTGLIDLDTPLGTAEPHMAVLRFLWNASSSYALSGALTTVSGSNVVTVDHVAHGLAECDHITIVGSSRVGGLDLDGVQTVETADVDSFTFRTKTNATGSETGGGPFTVFHGGETQTAQVVMNINHTDPVQQ